MTLIHYSLPKKLMSANESVTPPPRKRRKKEVEATEQDWEDELQGNTAHFAQLESTCATRLPSKKGPKKITLKITNSLF